MKFAACLKCSRCAPFAAKNFPNHQIRNNKERRKIIIQRPKLCTSLKKKRDGAMKAEKSFLRIKKCDLTLNGKMK